MVSLTRDIFGFGKRGFAIAVLLIGIRLWLGLKTGVWYQVLSPIDDSLLVNYAPLSMHFADISGAYSLAKTVSYPVFLNLVHYSGLPYTFVLSAVWALCGCLAVLFVRRLRAVGHPAGSGSVGSPGSPGSAGGHAQAGRGGRVARVARPAFELAVMAFVMFSPAAFDVSVGTRLYRNSIIAPFALLLFLLLILFALRVMKQGGLAGTGQGGLAGTGQGGCPDARRGGYAGYTKRHWACAAGIGVLLAFNYYITEAGMWLLPAMLAVLFVAGAIALRRCFKAGGGRRAAVRIALLCCVPLLVFSGATQVYKGVNYHYFGVYETNTRTAGEPGRFAANIYKIESQARTGAVWAPPDAVEKAFGASQALKGRPELEDVVMNYALWSGDLRENPSPGDHFTWVLIDAYEKSGLWQGHREEASFFKQVNAELDAAFKDGTLKKDTKIQLFSSAGGRTMQEILGLSPLALQGLKSGVMYDGYGYSGDIGGMSYSEQESPNNPMRVKAEFFLNMKLDNGQATDYWGQPLVFGAREQKAVDLAINAIFSTYQAAGLPAFIAGVAGLGICLARLSRKNRRTGEAFMYAVFMAMMMLSAFAVSFGGAWFSEFLIESGQDAAVKMHYYAVGAVPCVMLFTVAGAGALVESALMAKSQAKIQARSRVKKNLSNSVQPLEHAG